MASPGNEDAILRPWQYSVKLETNAKGWIQPSVHVYSDSANAITGLAVEMLERVVKDLRHSGFKVASDIRNGEVQA